MRGGWTSRVRSRYSASSGIGERLRARADADKQPAFVQWAYRQWWPYFFFGLVVFGEALKARSPLGLVAAGVLLIAGSGQLINLVRERRQRLREARRTGFALRNLRRPRARPRQQDHS